MSTTETTTSNSPSHVAYQVRDRKDKKGIWTRIGAAWPQKGGFSIQLDAIPFDGRIVLHIVSEQKDLSHSQPRAGRKARPPTSKGVLL